MAQRIGAEPSPVSATLRLAFAGFRLDIDTNSLRLAARLQSYFAAYLRRDASPAESQLQALVGAPAYDAAAMEVWRRPAPGRAPKESFYEAGGARFILKNRTGVLITLTSDGRAMITGDLEEYANQVVNLVGTMFGLSLLEQSFVMVHASSVVDQATGEALVFLGNSGSGKSSLALQLVERGGYDFLSNDRVLMRADADAVTVVGLPKKPRVNPGTLLASATLSRLVPRPRRRIYAQLPRDELWQLEEKTDVDVERELGARTRLTARLGRVYDLAWRPGGSGLVRAALSTEDALAALRGTAKDFGPYDLHAASRDPAPEYARIAACVPFTGVTGRADPAALAALIVAER